jgi:hypothetical protein
MSATATDISATVGSLPLDHLWSFTAARGEAYRNPAARMQEDHSSMTLWTLSSRVDSRTAEYRMALITASNMPSGVALASRVMEMSPIRNVRCGSVPFMSVCAEL